ncbi:MAG: NUDIX hydrolase [Blastocatellia bacterium]
MRNAIEEFVLENERWYDRALSIGHLTGSAWILDKERTHALLTHHRKLDLWVQLGGHTEGDADMLSAACREAREESGLPDVVPAAETIFDVDIHAIPARREEPAHFHYDIRYLFTADRGRPLTVSGESMSLAWAPLAEISNYTREESVLRMTRKTQALIL